MNRNCVIIVAAGKGARMKANINKQFLNLKDKPILYWTLKVFEKSNYVDEIILVLAKDEIEYCKSYIIDKYKVKKIKKIVEGGSTRQQSVINGLNAVGECNVVLIHDGARPFINDDIINEGIKYANLYGACACGVVPKDTIKIKEKSGFSMETPKRNTLFCVQTPQCFKYEIILESHKKAYKEKFEATDDTMIVEKYNHKVFLYNGSYSNIKITTPEDLIIGEKILDNSEEVLT
ncbi:2-C-methyl-D-erythritol 4-phosphate cytidylyltransferase [Clostridium aestuarii]|uniref:2-C-methyl-D-erythritol 4-phosphate cytidylyltransferase n=1 Tax=Clostridium aestuarii TaxID=338193 RepID=A0ABT4CXE9_9CLOT|nr:2-C-methyl-D-erythritol 4-phosphate cytidylyltransferase [Clostridium aestuarii]MCY6483522.1 2-C-methyl-D-erythritol 4-phosphate cytidylyltransferase [Clostridium aestuarii]